MKIRLLTIAAALSAMAMAASPAPKYKLGPKIRLFNGKNLDGFYTYLKKDGLNNDPNKVFRIENRTVHVSGTDYGYFVTKKEYENYYLTAEFKWGEKTHPPREGKARDSGILFHVVGPDQVWPKSIEFQMIEGGTGDILMVGNTMLTVKGQTKDRGRFDRFEKGPWKDVVGYRDPKREVEKPHGQWNRVEMWAKGGTVLYLVNGVLVNEGTNAAITKGKILFQTEGAEVYFRNLILRQIE